MVFISEVNFLTVCKMNALYLFCVLRWNSVKDFNVGFSA